MPVSANVAHTTKKSRKVCKSIPDEDEEEDQDTKEENSESTSRGRGRSNWGPGRGGKGRGGTRPTCQLCNKYGHDAFRCWWRFDQNFVQLSTNQGGYTPQWPPHMLQQPLSANFAAPRPPYGPPTPHFYAPRALENQLWYPASSASHHITCICFCYKLYFTFWTGVYRFMGTCIVSIFKWLCLLCYFCGRTHQVHVDV